MEECVTDLREDALIARLTAGSHLSGDVLVGPGDDCAVIDFSTSDGSLLLLKTDCVIESVHFAPGSDPEKVGWKAMCRVISDIAAMGGTPKHALVTIAFDSKRKVSEVEGWYRGMRKATREFGDFSIVGGETASLPTQGAIISISMTGSVSANRYFTRSGAKPGDLIAVTGRLGGSFKSERHLTFRPRFFEASWLGSLPEALRPTAMMDLSDGLSKDLPRLADLSGVPGFEIDFSKIPIHSDSDLKGAIGDGEDYELLMTLPQAAAVTLGKDWKKQFPDCELTVIGEMSDKQNRTPLEGGWEHF